MSAQSSAADGTRQPFLGAKAWQWAKVWNTFSRSRTDGVGRFVVWYAGLSIAAVLLIVNLDLADGPDESPQVIDVAAQQLHTCIEQTNERNICRAIFVSKLPPDYRFPNRSNQ